MILDSGLLVWLPCSLYGSLPLPLHFPTKIEFAWIAQVVLESPRRGQLLQMLQCRLL